MTLKNEDGSLKINYQVLILIIIYVVTITLAYAALAPRTYVDSQVEEVDQKIEKHADQQREDMRDIQKKFDTILERLPKK